MSLKQEIETWVQALAHYDNNEFDESLKSFDLIADTSKILFNCGVIQATLGEHAKAVECYQKAVRLDQYLAVAYFQQGVSNFLVGDFEEALANFNDTLLYLRGNTYIDYEQLGLKFKLYSCEVLFNRGLCYIYLQQKEVGLKDFQFAVKEKVVEDHNVIDEAILEEAEGYTVFSIPVGVVYRPNSAKVKNLKTKDYLGKARLVAASDRNNAFTGFTGSEVKNATPNPPLPPDDRPIENISFAASNLVKPDLRSRAVRQQSEPPLNRTVFPPTPPPEADRAPLSAGSSVGVPNSVGPINGGRPRSSEGPNSTNPSTLNGRSASLRNTPTRPERLDLSKTREQPQRLPGLQSKPFIPPQFQPRPQQQQQQQSQQSPSQQQQAPASIMERPRLGTLRTASEPRGPSRTYSNARTAEYGGFQPRYPNNSALRQGAPLAAPSPNRENGSANPNPNGTGTGPSPSARNAAQDEYPDDLYDMYRNTRPKYYPRRAESRSRPQPSQRPRFIEEEDESEGEGDEGGSDSFNEDDEDEFEMVSGGRPYKLPSRNPSRNPSGRAGSRRPDVRKIRVKVHVAEDTRYIMLAPSIDYYDLLDRIREKFALQRAAFKCRIEDDGDMITLGDQDDLDMAVQTAVGNARRERGDMGKMELWVQLSS